MKKIMFLHNGSNDDYFIAKDQASKLERQDLKICEFEDINDIACCFYLSDKNKEKVIKVWILKFDRRVLNFEEINEAYISGSMGDVDSVKIIRDTVYEILAEDGELEWF